MFVGLFSILHPSSCCKLLYLIILRQKHIRSIVLILKSLLSCTLSPKCYIFLFTFRTKFAKALKISRKLGKQTCKLLYFFFTKYKSAYKCFQSDQIFEVLPMLVTGYRYQINNKRQNVCDINIKIIT